MVGSLTIALAIPECYIWARASHSWDQGFAMHLYNVVCKEMVLWWNVDFSAEAVRLGQELETVLDNTQAMHWVQADLRSWADVSELSCFAPVDIILDKSTSDAIATSAPMAFSPSSDASDTCQEIQTIVQRDGEVTLLPVEVLALHLAPLARPGAIWIALSFSTMRFENLPHAMAHWAVVAREALKAPHGHSSPSVHTPEVFHWLYVLKRK
ncbi:hypothetical protein BDW42DRAFT_76025 [Aspergillus taichungensis]|uniref:Uncharacterized protein n=1 Tax=Aspergillus taichungensis TaxID=482145 RepID=A0A2J5I969_9EURO|nr:hypothetical protein BDW42DRAFT_76025 [Aspergillus taichungensis]